MQKGQGGMEAFRAVTSRFLVVPGTRRRRWRPAAQPAGAAAVLALSVFCAIAAGMILTAAPALAAPPQIPQEEEVTEITATSAQFSGVLDPAGKGEAGTYAFVYSASASQCEGILQQEPGGLSTPAKANRCKCP